jgi:hypothetical protein
VNGGGRATEAAFEHDADEVVQDAPLSLVLEVENDRRAVDDRLVKALVVDEGGETTSRNPDAPP